MPTTPRTKSTEEEEEEEEEERQNVMVRGVTNGGLSHGNPHDNKQTYT